MDSDCKHSMTCSNIDKLRLWKESLGQFKTIQTIIQPSIQLIRINLTNAKCSFQRMRKKNETAHLEHDGNEGKYLFSINLSP